MQGSAMVVAMAKWAKYFATRARCASFGDQVRERPRPGLQHFVVIAWARRRRRRH